MRRDALGALAPVLLIVSGAVLLLLGLGSLFRGCVASLHILPGGDVFAWSAPALLLGLVLLAVGVGLAHGRRSRRKPQP